MRACVRACVESFDKWKRSIEQWVKEKDKGVMCVVDYAYVHACVRARLRQLHVLVKNTNTFVAYNTSLPIISVIVILILVQADTAHKETHTRTHARTHARTHTHTHKHKICVLPASSLYG